MSLAVVCPSRERPQRCSAMIESVINTSEADILIYFDEDDATKPVPAGAWNSPRVKTMVGPRMGRGMAINALCSRHDYRAYLLVSDDVTFTRKGWDRDILNAMDSFKDDLGVVHLHNGTDAKFCNWPCVSKKWINALGWFNPPTLRSYCQDTSLQALGEALDRIVCIETPAISHDCISSDSGHYEKDREAFLWFMALQFGPCLRKLRAAM